MTQRLLVDIGLLGVVPALAALVAGWLLARAGSTVRYSAAVGLAAGFFLGYALLPKWAVLTPERHWHWLPYLGLAAALLGPVGELPTLRRVERYLLLMLLALAAAWLLVPTWANLETSRVILIPALAAYLVLLPVGLRPLTDRSSGRVLEIALALSAWAVAAIVAGAVSVTYGLLAAVAAASVVGATVTSAVVADRATLRGLLAVYSLLIGGVASVGFIEPQPPLAAPLIAAAAPLTLWLCVAGPLARLRSVARWAVQIILVLLVLGAATGWALLR